MRYFMILIMAFLMCSCGEMHKEAEQYGKDSIILCKTEVEKEKNWDTIPVCCYKRCAVKFYRDLCNYQCVKHLTNVFRLELKEKH